MSTGSDQEPERISDVTRILVTLLLVTVAGFSQLIAQVPTRLLKEVPSSVRVVAFMVEFQPDSNPLTFGDGTFNLAARDSGFLDSWPHDSSFFANHLVFLKNWWERVSQNRLTIDTHLIPGVIRLPHPMATYSGVGQPADSGYARLIRDFSRAVATHPGLATLDVGSVPTHFILFHAGLGRDINWVQILGGDPTPADLSSIFLGRKWFSEVYGTTPNLKAGLPLDNLSILPETLSRTVTSFGQTVLLNFGINGLMVANTGNFLGLPDLYDSKTGSSRTGRFGLMDGYGFFNYNGFLPTPPSAWERYQLGWETPRVFDVWNLPGQFTFSDSEPEPVFIHTGNGRYFLIERRLRYPAGTTRQVTITTNDLGSLTSKTYPFDATGFYTYDQSGLKGVITDISNPDWVIPAGYTLRNGVNDTIDGGLLIWKLDDSRLKDLLATGKESLLNTGSKPVLTLAEADGSADIGASFGEFTAGSGSETGTVFDYWYDTNIAPLFKAEFSQTSTPSSEWNYKEPTGLTLSGFIRDGRTFRVQTAWSDPGGSLPAVSRFTRSFPFNPTAGYWMVSGTDSLFAFRSSDSAFVYRNQLLLSKKRLDGSTTLFMAIGKSDTLIVLTSSGDRQIEQWQVTTTGFEARDVDLSVVPPGFNCEPVVQTAGNGWGLIFRSGTEYLGARIDHQTGVVSLSASLTVPSGAIEAIRAFWVHSGTNWVPVLNWKGTTGQQWLPLLPGRSVAETRFTSVWSGSDQKSILVTDAQGNLLTGSINSLTETDFTVTGRIPSSNQDLLLSAPDGWYSVSHEGTLLSMSYNGILLPGFPVSLRDTITQVLVADDQTTPFLLVRTGGSVVSVPVQSPDQFRYILADLTTATGTGTEVFPVRMIGEKTAEFQRWTGRVAAMGTPSNHQAGFMVFNRTSRAATHQDMAESYAWPNPATGSEVRFRYKLPFTGSGTITISDLTGDLVKKMSFDSSAFVESEVVWTCSDSQPGLYLARFHASGEGKSHTRIIKVVLSR